MEILEFYKFTFTSIDSLIKFAEAKNLALIGFNGSVIFGILATLKDYDRLKFTNWTIVFFLLMITTQICSLSVAYYAVKPRAEIPTQTLMPNVDRANLTFFKHIAQFTPSDYHKQTLKKYKFMSCNTKLEKDYAYNIVQLAVIVDNKFTAFNNALKINFITIFLLAVWFIGFVVIIRKKIKTTTKTDIA